MDTPVVTNLDLICRTCITESTELVNLFHYSDDEIVSSVADVLRYYAEIQISEDDGLPSNLCLQCLSFLSQCIKFLRKCKYSDNILRNLKDSVSSETIETKVEISEQLVENIINEELTNSNIIENCIEYELLDFSKSNDTNLDEGIIEEEVSRDNIDVEALVETSNDCINTNENTIGEQNFMWLQFRNNEGVIVEETSNIKIETNEDSTEDSRPSSEMAVTAYYNSENFEKLDCEEPSQIDINISEISSDVQNNDLDNNTSLEYCEVFDETSIIVVSSEEKIDGFDVFKIYASDYKTYHGLYFYVVGNGTTPAKCKRRNYAYYERVSDETSRQLDRDEPEEEDYELNTVKKYNCKFCGKQFNTKSTLLRHLRTHTGEKPYLCADCGKQFATLSGLDLHQRRHLGEKRYQCCHCGRKFVDNSNLRKHIQSHTGEKPFYCDQCGKNFGRKFLLDLHMRTHTGEKPYQCEVCSRSFRQLGDFRAHRRIHSGERPHKCKVCGKGFIKSSAMQLHMKSHLRNQR